METISKVRNTLLVLLFLVIGSNCASGKDYVQDKSNRREYTKTYKVNPSDKVDIDNKYGDITITHWGKNEVEIRVVVEASARNEARVKELLNYVSIDFDQKGGTVYGKTNLKTFGGNRNNERIKIDYHVSMPSTLASNLKVRYGNIHMPTQNKGNTSIDIAYGNIHGGHFTGRFDVVQKYGNLKVINLKKAVLDMSYSGDITIGEAEDIHCISKYSNLKLGDIVDLVVDNSYGNIDINSIVRIDLRLKYGNIDIKHLKESFDASQFSYSNLKIKEIDSRFSRFNLEGSYSNATLYLDKAAKLNVEVNQMKYGKFQTNGLNVQTEKVGDNYKVKINNGDSRRVIRFNGKNYSNLTLQGL
ncbi:hypothetical protein LJC54_00600 [Parabacteroides sp. OttesenSCG-928-J18]|nr:hypothetical protein [Parabacteroides sp. OttesenSCG-928-J18]